MPPPEREEPPLLLCAAGAAMGTGAGTGGGGGERGGGGGLAQTGSWSSSPPAWKCGGRPHRSELPGSRLTLTSLQRGDHVCES